MLATLNTLDVELFRLINSGLATSRLDGAMIFLSSKYTWLALAAGVIFFAVWRRSRRLLYFCAATMVTIGLVDFVTYHFLKAAFARERPCRQFQDEHLLQQWCGGDYGFPSNHAANGMALTVLTAFVFGRRAALGALALTLLVGFSRVYVGVHFPGDVLGGFAFGALLGLGCGWLAKRSFAGMAKLRQ